MSWRLEIAEIKEVIAARADTSPEQAAALRKNAEDIRWIDDMPHLQDQVHFENIRAKVARTTDSTTTKTRLKTDEKRISRKLHTVPDPKSEKERA